ncbi:Ogr/Delta-like zinc finger [Comamonas aquatica]|nr:ogr/Delta-like zinc finger family protein [Comamonas aquatica]CAB5659093.1 Ogr/Delta-like zinc finger [Comamonas aquatica]CAC9181691.1 Ogr/Delta-like zinc finger [Comamonas aquatica]
MKFLCPHCQAKTVIRTSETVNQLLRKLTFQCQDPECGHTFMAWLEAYCTLSLSAKPDPMVYLPMSEAARRQALEHPTLTSAWRKATVASPDALPAEPARPTDRVQKKAPQALPAPDAITQALFAQAPGQAVRP